VNREKGSGSAHTGKERKSGVGMRIEWRHFISVHIAHILKKGCLTCENNKTCESEVNGDQT
jgi:hypothetical protein